MATTHEHQEVENEVAPSWRTTFLGADREGRVDNASWGAIVAGVAVALAVLIAFALVAAALGLGMTDPTSDQPFDGVGMAVGLWTILTLALAMAAGGFVAGVLAVKAGFLHGLAVWAATTIAAAVVVVLAISGVVGVAANLTGAVASNLGRAAGTLAETAGDAVSSATEGVADAVGDVDLTGLDDDIEQILADTGVPELQPDYLQGQVDEVRTEIGDAARQLLTDPGGYEQILDDLAASLQERSETIVDAVDRDAVATAVAENTDLTDDEATEAVDEAVEWAEQAGAAFGDALDDAQAALDDARETVVGLVDDARETLDDASDAAARAALWTFVGVLVAAVIASFAGLWGSRLVAGRDDSGELRRRRATVPGGPLPPQR